MIKRKPLWLAAAALMMPLSMPLAAQTAQLNIEFLQPDRFTDIEPAGGNRPEFQQRTLNGISEIFTELVQTLPGDQVLQVTVTDVNLAGRVGYLQHNGYMERMRMLGERPTMKLDYTLLDAEGNVLREGEEYLRGSSRATHLVRRTNRLDQQLGQEKEMIERWFKRKLNG